MSKLPTKQIYLLLVIIVGIIALSIYSTYAIFTLESHTSDIVNIHTPNSIKISEDIYEYKQISVEKNSYITTDIDIYNTFDYELCYSIWYKALGKEIDSSKVKIYQHIEKGLTSSGTIESMKGTRVKLIIINDNDTLAKVNIGVSSAEKEDTCALNISEDKSVVTTTINDYKELSTAIQENVNKPQMNEENYLTYKNIREEITLSNDNKIYISDEFTYTNELFTLKDYKEIDAKEIKDYISDESTSYYTCIDTADCQKIIKINSYKMEKIIDEITKAEIEIYKINNYDLLEGYLKGESGIKKVTENNIDNYLYYGDNPNNFIYYNCLNEQNNDTCELWRIIGTYYDQEEDKYLTKIIKNDFIGEYQYNQNNNNLWEEATLNKYLNDEYKLNKDYYIKEITYNQNYLESLNSDLKEIKLFDKQIKTKINIMSITDYINSSVCLNKKIDEYDEQCLKNNWLNKGNEIKEWTMTAKYLKPMISNDEEPTEEIITENNKIYTVGNTIEETSVDETINLRPVVYLKSRMLLVSGEGTLESPYVIK